MPALQVCEDCGASPTLKESTCRGQEVEVSCDCPDTCIHLVPDALPEKWTE